jgi:hypothetical protein
MGAIIFAGETYKNPVKPSKKRGFIFEIAGKVCSVKSNEK